MGTHCLIFLTIGNLVSPPSFPFAGQVKGRTGLAPSKRKICPVSAARESRAVKPWRLVEAVVSLVSPCETRCLLIRGASIRHVTTGLGGPRFRWSHDRFLAQFFFGSNPVLDIFPVFSAALKIQLIRPASDLFS